ncbi:MAG: sugar ABC transporter substrate-binding protein [Cyanobacteriota bacterium]|nr:sugar ABC transporter substrate-binding protein [Cyanobacteriota bacterium]
MTQAYSQTLDGFEKAKGCNNIAILLPESDSSARYEAYDRPLLEAGLKAALPEVTISYANANNNAATQQNQAEAALAKGACIMILDPKDSDAAGAIVSQAKASGVPVISYDRLIQSDDLAFYVSFDNFKVGELQGEWIASNYQKGDKLVMINGSQTDNNAILFREGAISKLQPLADQGEIDIVYDQYTPDWNNATAQANMEGALTKEKNDVQIAYVANDGMANSVIAALRAQQLNGKVLVTGQDATVAGIQNILTGDQGMTVYKPIPAEAQATVDLVVALVKGEDTSKIATTRVKNRNGVEIPSLLLSPVTVTKDNVADTVIKDGFVSLEEVCKGLPSGTAGLCP